MGGDGVTKVVSRKLPRESEIEAAQLAEADVRAADSKAEAA
jgi:hypothetical protein